MNKGGLQRIKVKEMELEAQNVDRSSSPYTDAPSDPQYDQSFVGDTQIVK